ncbi:plasmid recombination protein, partial [Staphylococcus epidermidis]|uniref:plasmid recombination protein n=1 Tax=Staphylococcus epidermidis TaxID=1282 RepID=UPI001642E2E9
MPKPSYPQTPHVHFQILPITQHRPLTPKHLLRNKKPLPTFQHKFNHYLNQPPYQLQQPTSTQLTNTQHHQLNTYKQKTQYHNQQYQPDTQKTHHINQNNHKLIQHYQKSLNTLKNPINLPYHQQTQKLPALFTKQIQQTPNLLITQKHFNQFHKHIKPTQHIS